MSVITMEENGRIFSFIFDGGNAVAEEETEGNMIRVIRGWS